MSKKTFSNTADEVIDTILGTADEPETARQEENPTRKKRAQSNEYIRYTLIAREDLIEQLKAYAMTEGKTVKEVMEDVLTQYLQDKKINNTFTKYIRDKKEK